MGMNADSFHILSLLNERLGCERRKEKKSLNKMRVKPQKIVRSEEESMNNTCSQKWAEWCNFGMSTGYSFNFHWHEKTATNIVSSKKLIQPRKEDIYAQNSDFKSFNNMYIFHVILLQFNVFDLVYIKFIPNTFSLFCFVLHFYILSRCFNLKNIAYCILHYIKQIIVIIKIIINGPTASLCVHHTECEQS